MFTKLIKIAQLLLLYCVIVQSYVAAENRLLKQGANFFQDFCNNIIYDNKQGKNGSSEIDVLPFFLLSYKWSISKSYHSNIGGRTFNEHPLEDQPSVPVEKSDNKVKGRKITVNELIKRTKLIVTYMKKFQKDAKSAVTNPLQNFKEDNFDEKLLLTFVMMIHQWTSDVIVLNTIGKSYYEKILMLPERCIPQLARTNYTLQDRIIMSSDIISIIKMIHIQLHMKSEELLEEKSYHTMERNSRTAEQLIKLIKSIVFELNEKLNSEETIIPLSLNKDIVKLQLLSYKWVLNIRYPNIRKKFVNKTSQSSLKDQSSLPIDKHDNEPTDQQKNDADVLKREGRLLTIDGKTIDDSPKTVCRFKQTIHHTIEMQLYVFGRITHEWITFEDYTTEGRSLNDFQLPLEDQSFSLPVEESGYELEDDEITIKDFMDNVKLTKRQINENLKIFEETTMNTDNESSQKLRNARDAHIYVKRSNIDSINEFLNYLRLKYILTIYRWISNIIIYNTIGKMSLGEIFPRLRECQPMFPVKETNEQLKEFEEISDEIIYLTQLLQAASVI